jgi:hypothetical protein
MMLIDRMFCRSSWLKRQSHRPVVRIEPRAPSPLRRAPLLDLLVDASDLGSDGVGLGMALAAAGQ